MDRFGFWDKPASSPSPFKSGGKPCLRPQKDRQRLLVGRLGAGLEFWQGAAADGMLDREERVVGQAEHAGDVAGRDLERHGAQHHRALAELFEADAVVQTAR